MLLHVPCEFLGAGLVQRPVKLNEAECVTCIIYYYHLLINYYNILLLDLLLLIITVLLLHYYYASLHSSILRIITFSLLH